MIEIDESVSIKKRTVNYLILTKKNRYCMGLFSIYISDNFLVQKNVSQI